MGQFQMIPKLKYIYLVKCWNAYVKGKEIKTYSFAENELMPEFL